ncbi:MAG: RNA-binding protein [Candidatus Omnitrophota bacterium]
MDIFLGNLSFGATEVAVKKVFEGFGSVASVVIIKEKDGVKSRGFGFVRMPDTREAQAAIAALDAKEFMGRLLNVSQARSKPKITQAGAKRKKIQKKFKPETQKDIRKEDSQKKPWFDPVFKRKSGYKQGRRSRSFMLRGAKAGSKGGSAVKKKSGD